MNEETNEKKSKLSAGEIVWTCISGAIAFGGLFMIVLGIVGDYWGVKADDNWILQGETAFKTTMKMSYRWFGVILLLAAALIAVIFLNHYAKKSDVDEERAIRRAQRLQVISQSAPEAPAPAAVEVPSTPKDETKPS